ncbi:MAG: uracil-DNA glycosylase [Thermoplasmata archaeon]
MSALVRPLRPVRSPARSSSVEGPRTVAWQELSREIDACRRCPLGSVRTRAVIYRGSERPRFVFVGEAPGRAEDLVGRPFVGRGGQILDAAIAHVGLDRSEFGIVNLIKCRPPENCFDRSAAETCRPYLDRQLELLEPRALISLGRFALGALVPGAPAILRSAGVPQDAGGRPLYPLVHPAATLRSRALAQRWSRDLDGLARWIITFRQ